MSTDKYSVLLMRDDAKVKRFRISSFWIRFLVYMCVLLVVLAVGGLYIGYTMWRENDRLTEERQRLERELRDTQVHLERLQNMEKIFQSNDPEELETLIGAIEEEKEPEKPLMDLKELMQKVDMGLSVLENVSLKRLDGNMRLSFDVVNSNTAEPLSGKVEVSLITRDGRTLDLTVSDTEEMTFQIQRYKNISVTFLLPEDEKFKELFALRITINTPAGKTIYSEAYPLYLILPS